jgi:VCBS repeat protein
MKILLSYGLLILAVLLAGCPTPKVEKKMPPLFVLSFATEAGVAPSFLITDDFNRDGKLDLVVTNSGDHTFSFFKGNGDGTFKDQKVFATGRDPICVVAADFNQDGYLDLAELNYEDQNIQIFLNTRLGSFQNIGVKMKVGKIPINLTAGDFNEDGFPDLAVTLRFHKVVTLLGKGNGKFSDPESMPVKGQPTALVLGDYNHDSHVDIAVALAGSGNRGVQILWGKGDGKFNPSKLFKGGGQPLTIVNLDVNGDGYGDLVTSSNVLHAMTTVINNGDETFRTLRDFASGSFPKFVVAADFTGDGLTDIAVSNSTDDAITVSLGKGDGTFTYPPIYHRVDEYPQGVAVGDFDGDGLIDLAVACRDEGNINILLKRNMVNPRPNPLKPDKTT